MEDGRLRRLTPPADLRPAQLGIVWVGRVIFGHISATLVDLATQGFVGVDEVRGDGEPDWVLADLRETVAGRGTLLAFETTLLNGLFAGQSAVRLSEVSQALVPTLDRVRAQLRHDAVRHGWLRRWPADRRTSRGEQLLKQINLFRKELRELVASGDPALGDLVPCAVLFGLRAQSLAVGASLAADQARPSEVEVTWSQTDRFVLRWQSACASFSYRLGDDHGHHADTGPAGNFVQQWSAPVTHSQPGRGHGSGHDAYSGGYRHFDGGHVAGGHSGH